LAVLAYFPGLDGGFLFDDLVNLDALGKSGAIADPARLARYLTAGTADPIGRPLSLLSFLIDARDWPADPAPFLRTNLLIQIANGILLALLLRTLGAALGDESRRARCVALLGAAMWLLHPLFVSTALYVVQREAMLATTFVFLGLLAWVKGRRLLADGESRRGVAWMWAGVVFGTVLATGCKANGVLLPLLAGVLEACIPWRPAQPGQARLLRASRWALLVIPSALVIGYLISGLMQWNHQPSNRPWTVGDRVLAESFVLFDYVRELLVPRALSAGLFNDHLRPPHGSVELAWSLLAWAALCIAGWTAWRFRRRAPAAACAVLFFLAGHVLESTTIPLELYFEHRNYLPAALLFWPVARALIAWPSSPGLRILAASALVGLLFWSTWQRSTLWANQDRLAEVWLRTNPDSPRAMAFAATRWVVSGRARDAVELVRPRLMRDRGEAQYAASYYLALCESGIGISRDDARLLRIAPATPGNNPDLMQRWIGSAIGAAIRGECKGLGLATTRDWAEAFRASAGDRVAAAATGERLLGLQSLAEEEPAEALEHFNSSLALNISPAQAAIQSAQLAARGYFTEALAHLDRYEALRPAMPPPRLGMPIVHAWILERQGYWVHEMGWLRSNF
jgi:tetratricopeptide (TPR) repeat protein